ncbi:hypothetical protein SCLCIDRAFT_1224520 [Scleroderma citrinum Foug A]|uniref:Uncharacterized protein n=1 Tax=Scleroderma citrinum Foug A TaxID=1036808 RepID=A0A0C3D5X9_9AGAM|nr:hypothetical protein SCLCIDRAFT_1224520 [Scleroderma citrinum Foug A]
MKRYTKKRLGKGKKSGERGREEEGEQREVLRIDRDEGGETAESLTGGHDLKFEGLTTRSQVQMTSFESIYLTLGDATTLLEHGWHSP